MPTSLQIIVVNYRTPGDLGQFLDSIEEDIDHKTYVANVEAQEDDLLAVKRRASVVDHQIVFEENVGYARAVNYAASRTTSKYIGIFNADVVLSPQVLTEAVRALEWEPEWGVLAPRQVDERGLITHAGIFGTPDHPQHRAWQQQDSDVFADVRTDAVTLSGAALVVRRECWDQMMDCPIFRDVFPSADGAFAVTPHYYEETAFIYHLIHHGWKAVYYGPLRVIHKWHKASQVGGWAEQQMPISQEIFRKFCDAHDMAHD